MGVLSIFRRFIMIMYSSILCVVVFINLLSYSGINVFNGGAFDVYGTNGNNFSNSYFGFSSIFSSLNDLNVGNAYQGFTDAFNKLFSSLGVAVSSIERVINSADAGTAILNVLISIADILVAPIRTLLYFINFLLWLLALLYDLLSWFTRLIGGYYNIPLRTM